MMDAAFPSWMLNGAALLGVYMLAVSALTVLVYAKDKSAAERGLWRVRESTLHLWSLLGGWPGAYVAQRALRHKTRKDAFLTRYRLTVAANCGVVALVFVLLPSRRVSVRRSRGGGVDHVQGIGHHGLPLTSWGEGGGGRGRSDWTHTRDGCGAICRASTARGPGTIRGSEPTGRSQF